MAEEEEHRDKELEDIYKNMKRGDRTEPYTAEDSVEDTIQDNVNAEQEQEQDEQDPTSHLRLQKPMDFNPQSNIDVANLLIGPSQLTSYMPEQDKEIKLGNLSSVDKQSIWDFQSVWEDVMWLRKDLDLKDKEYKELYGNDYMNQFPEDQRMEKIQNRGDSPYIFDSLSSLSKSVRVATISRGSKGFERRYQVSTISTHKNEEVDKSQEKPGFLSKLSGGFKR